jgi:hypothetical protein
VNDDVLVCALRSGLRAVCCARLSVLCALLGMGVGCCVYDGGLRRERSLALAFAALRWLRWLRWLRCEVRRWASWGGLHCACSRRRSDAASQAAGWRL